MPTLADAITIADIYLEKSTPILEKPPIDIYVLPNFYADWPTMIRDARIFGAKHHDYLYIIANHSYFEIISDRQAIFKSMRIPLARQNLIRVYPDANT